ncbi:MAG: hypothetical protein AMXMBFR64_23710 [Myxococcales bacterium]
MARARVNEALGELAEDMREGLDEGAAEAYILANKHLTEQVKTFSRQFEGTVRPTSWEALLALDDEVLLDKHAASASAYATDLRRRVQQRLMDGLVREEPWSQTVRDLASRHGLLAQDYFGMNSTDSHRQSRAERIVRTELAHAYNRAHHEDLARADAEDPGYQKTLVATFDDRTGFDSYAAHEQVRAEGHVDEAPGIVQVRLLRSARASAGAGRGLPGRRRARVPAPARAAE